MVQMRDLHGPTERLRPQSHTTFSLLPDCLAARLPGTLDALEAVAVAAGRAASLAAAANQLRRDAIELPGAMRWVRRRVRLVHNALARVYPAPGQDDDRVRPDWDAVIEELTAPRKRRRARLTRRQLWVEYRDETLAQGGKARTRSSGHAGLAASSVTTPSGSNSTRSPTISATEVAPEIG